MGEDDDKQNKKLLESPKKRRLNLKAEKDTKFGRIVVSENNANRRSLRLRRLYAQNTSI